MRRDAGAVSARARIVHQLPGDKDVEQDKEQVA